jgi:hypothetical protein
MSHTHTHTHGGERGHLHTDPLTHTHGESAVEPALPPSRQGTVVLDIGDGIGALVVHTPKAMCGAEIEIAPRGGTTQLVHTEVRERVLPEGSVFAGVFVALDEGEYTLLDADGSGPQDLTIHSGRVTEISLFG